MSSEPSDSTVDFQYENPEVDTGWPDDTGYDSARRRAPDSGWRIQLHRR